MILFLVSSLPIAYSTKQNGYSEKIELYVVGNHALWSVTFGGINVTSAVKGFEQIQGINSYNITAINTENWVSDFQLFGPYGYNLLGIPYVPVSGIFLAVNASGRGAADQLASQMGSYFYTYFAPINSSGSIFLYFAPISFSDIMPTTLLRLLPSKLGGFASLLSSSTFLTQSSPTIRLEALNKDGSYLYSLTLSSISNSVLSSSNSINLLSVIGSSRNFIMSSNFSSSSTIRISVLDGIISSKDNATVSNNIKDMKGYYILDLKSSEKLYRVNVTVTQQQPSLIVKRSIDNGSPEKNKPLSVTLTFSNISNKTIYNVTLDDSWYKAYGFFKLQSGDSSIRIDNITAGQTTSRTYVLNYTGGNTMTITVPPETAFYTYKVGSSNFNGTSYVNGATLSPGLTEPSLYAFLSVDSGSLKAGGSVKATLDVFNVGSSPALNVSAAGQSIQTIPQGGGRWTSTFQINSESLTQLEITKQLNITYYTPEGKKQQFQTNSINLSVDHNSVKFPFAQVTYDGTLLQRGNSLNLTLNIKVSNKGLVNITSFLLSGKLPSILGCGKVYGANLTCRDSTLAASYSAIRPGQTEKASISYLLNSSENVILKPLNYSFSSASKYFSGQTNMVGFPSGFSVSKYISPSMLFNGMNANVTVSLLNSGPGVYSNISLRTSQDSFDTVVSNSTSYSANRLAAGDRLSFSYLVKVTQAGKGTKQLSPVSMSMIFAGRKFSFSLQNGTAEILPSPVVSFRTVPTQPVELKNFFLIINVTNPSRVTVSNLTFSMKIPRNIQVTRIISGGGVVNLNGSLKIVIPSMGPGQSNIYNITLTSSSGTVIDFSGSTFTFSYRNQLLYGTLPAQGIIINENTLSRYLLPSFLALIAVLAATFYIRYRLVRRV